MTNLPALPKLLPGGGCYDIFPIHTEQSWAAGLLQKWGGGWFEYQTTEDGLPHLETGDANWQILRRINIQSRACIEAPIYHQNPYVCIDIDCLLPRLSTTIGCSSWRRQRPSNGSVLRTPDSTGSSSNPLHQFLSWMGRTSSCGSAMRPSITET
jgi:hypothetical protein